MPDIGNRYVDRFIRELPTGLQSPYYRTMTPGIIAFEQEPVLGIGTGNFRHMCEEIVGENIDKFDYHPHPHNFYIQMAAETRSLGLILGTVFLWSIIWTCFRASWNRDNVVLATAWVVPFGLFWPITSSADFFGQWNNIFMWSAVALALAAMNLARLGQTHLTRRNADRIGGYAAIAKPPWLWGRANIVKTIYFPMKKIDIFSRP